MMEQVVIVGGAESERLGKIPDMSAWALAAQSVHLALRQAGLTLADVDGLAGTLPTLDLANNLGIRPRWMDGTAVGGCSFMLHVRHAVAAIRAGHASVVVVAHGESGRSRVGQPLRVPDPSSYTGQFENPFGTSGTFSRFTLPALAWLRKHGHRPEDLAEVPAAQSHWAARNSRAARPQIVTRDDVLASRLVCWPFHLLECCPLSDGGGAVVLTSARRARDLDLHHPAIVVAGTGESCEGPSVGAMEEPTSFRAFREASAAAFAEAGMTPADIDHLMVYDAYAHVPLYGLQDLGFVRPGEAVDFIRDGHTRPGGRLPMNTNGGGLLYCHTGQYGMFAILEAVRQLQGRAEAQVDGLRTSFVQGIGYMFGAAGSLILTRE